MIETSIGNGYVVTQQHNSFDLWCKPITDNTPFYFWRNAEGNHIWEKMAVKDVPTWVITEFVNAIKGD
jgi:hypothetical protein